MLVVEFLFRILGPEFFHRMKGRPNVPDIAAIDIQQLVDLEPRDDLPRMAVGIVRLARIDDEAVALESIAEFGHDRSGAKRPDGGGVASNNPTGGRWLEKVMSSA